MPGRVLGYAVPVAKKPSSTSKKTAKAEASAVAEAEPRQAAPGVAVPRPGLLRDVIGQPRAISNLTAAMKARRLHHAWIFHGPPGVGKFTTALAFAACVLDPTTTVSREDGLPVPDPASSVQRLLASGAHPDLHVIVKELAKFSEEPSVRSGKQITIAKEVVEAHLIRPAALAPLMNSGGAATKVFIVDEAELLDRSVYNAPTQNSILKTLEEPTPGNVIILVTSAEDRLLPTIRSRCQRIAFNRLAAPQLNEWIRRSKVELPAASAQWLIEYADGSPGDLIKALATGIAEWHAQIAPLLAELDTGRQPSDLGGLMGTLIEAEAQRLVKASPNVSKEASNKVAADAMFRLVAHHIRGKLRAEAAKLPQGSRTVEARMRCLDVLGEAERNVDANVQAVFACSNMVAQMGVAMAGAM
ncbi:MAG: hypothetical protein GIKADHBN_01927 [Phycisphaerales bacterium]|nr:hypothetical protein [Phycisphaerales bacterium]